MLSRIAERRLDWGMISTVVVLVLFGLLTLMLEAFVPGGILGTIGVICILVAAAVVAFSDELNLTSTQRAILSPAIIVFSMVVIAVWLRFFAVSLFNRAFTLQAEISSPVNKLVSAVGASGVAVTELRPLGKVQLDNGERYEARLLNGHAQAGTRITVVNTEPGNLVVTLSSQV